MCALDTAPGNRLRGSLTQSRYTPAVDNITLGFLHKLCSLSQRGAEAIRLRSWSRLAAPTLENILA